jgi:hypothetical protein
MTEGSFPGLRMGITTAILPYKVVHGEEKVLGSWWEV